MTKTTTTTREYDDEGRMVKETTVVQEYSDVVGPRCCCVAGVHGGYCPVHGYGGYQLTWTSPSITINSSDTNGAVAALEYR